MGFSGIGIWEILLILVVALIVLGPKRLPEIARTLGKTVRAIKKASTDLTTAVTREVEAQEQKPPPSPAKEDSTAAAGKTPSAISKADSTGQDNPPTRPKKASAK